MEKVWTQSISLKVTTADSGGVVYHIESDYGNTHVDYYMWIMCPKTGEYTYIYNTFVYLQYCTLRAHTYDSMTIKL